jgi:rfaE bifunctional protein nucleotidyltransferase chain/domain
VSPLLGPEAAAAEAARLRAAGRAVVLAGGVFDLLHPGHVRYLAAARAAGDFLLVAVNGDRSAGARKGPGRPLQDAAARAEVVAALRATDAVTIFEEGDLAATIRRVRPAIVAKGSDWTLERLPPEERAAAEEVGARWAFVGGEKLDSSTAIAARAAGA